MKNILGKLQIAAGVIFVVALCATFMFSNIGTSNDTDVAYADNGSLGTPGGSGVDPASPSGSGVKTPTPKPTATVDPSADPSAKKVGTLVVVIKDEETGDPIPNAKIEVTSPNGDINTYTTDDKGTVTVSDTATGKYSIKILEAPEGYSVSKDKVLEADVEEDKTTDATISVAKSDDSDVDDDDDDNGSGDAEETEGGVGDPSFQQGDDSSNGAGSGNDSTVDTSDSFAMEIPIVGMIVSLLAIFVLSFVKKHSDSIK